MPPPANSPLSQSPWAPAAIAPPSWCCAEARRFVPGNSASDGARAASTIAWRVAVESKMPGGPRPDRERGAVVKAYVVLAAGVEASDALVQDLQHHVRGKLAPYEYPKEIEFVAALPMTTTGKVQRRVLRLQEEARAAGISG